METKITEKKDLLASLLQGRMDFFRSCAIYSPLPTAGLQATPEGRIRFASGIDFAVCNGVMGEDNLTPSKVEIEETVQFFKTRNLPFIWWNSTTIEHEGFQPGGTLTGIVVDIMEDIVQQASNVSIRIANTPEEFKLFAHVSGQSFGMQGEVLDQFMRVSQAAMEKEEQFHLLAYLNDTAVGTITLSTSPTSAGIWNLTTLPDYRNKGVGTQLVKAALFEAQTRNYDHVMAILMPKGMAWNLCSNLNFKEVCQFPFYIHGATAKDLEK